MDFIADTIDSGAPEYVVTGIASIKRISAGMIRISKYVRREEGNVIVCHEVWDYELWKRAIPPYQRAADIIDRAPVPDGHEARQGKH